MTCADVVTERIKKKKVVVWGTGKDSVKATYRLSEAGISVFKYVCGVNRANCESFMNRPLESADDSIYGKEYFYVVAVREVFWKEVKDWLINTGHSEFEDFVFWKTIDSHRKMVMLHGNCHFDIIQLFLESSSIFNARYWIYPYERVCFLRENRYYDRLIQYTDVWIYQHIKPDNSICYEISDEYTLPLLRQDALKLSVPNYYHLGKILFPQTVQGNQLNPPIREGKDKNGFFPRSDSVIDGWMNNHPEEFKIKDLLEYCYSDEALPEDVILENYNFMAEKIKVREENCDIKVSDFIIGNFMDKQMFYDLGHPTNVVLKQISRGILRKLGISDDEDIVCADSLCYHEDPVYPQVRKALGLKWERKYIRDNDKSKKINENMDFSEYVREYLMWCYEDRKWN